MAHLSFRRIFAHLAVVCLSLSGVVAVQLVEANASGSVDAKVAIGSQHVVAVGSDGTVWTWGSLIPGPTGVGSKDSLKGPTQVLLPSQRTAIDVAATHNASFAVAADGTVWAWGSLGRGLGDLSSTTDSRYTDPVQVRFPAGVSVVEVSAACEGVMARSSSGDVYQWGYFYGNWQMSYDTPTKLDGVSNAMSISRGCSSSFAILSDGTAKAWGSNGGGRLGDGTTTDRPSPVAISLPNGKQFARISSSSSHSLAVATDGTLFGWGGNSNGQLGADPNSLSYQTQPRVISLGSGSARDVTASDSTPFSTVVTNTNSILKWGGWGTSDYISSPIPLPSNDFGSRTMQRVVSNQGATFFIASDNSIWARGWWWNVDLDGNCGANASDYASWRDGVTVPSRSVVRTTSQGQFGPIYSEDQMTISKLESGAGLNLPLDGSGSLTGTVGEQISVVLTSPRSSCFDAGELRYEVSQDNGTSWSSSGATVSTNNFAQTIVNLSFTPNSSGRRRAFVRLVNPNGQTQSYRFNLGIAAAPSNSTPVSATDLPIVETALNTSLAIGTDGFLYAWGASRYITGENIFVKEPKRIIPSAEVSMTPTTSTTSTTTVPPATTTTTTTTTSTTTVPSTTIAPTTTTGDIPYPTTTTIPPTTTTSVAVTPTTTVVSATTTSVTPSTSTTTTTTTQPAITNEDMSLLRFRSISMIQESYDGSNIIAAAVSEDGRLFVWGKSSGNDQILGASTEIARPRSLAISQNRRAVSVQLLSSWTSTCDSTCTSGYSVFGFIIDDSGSVLAWGGGSPYANRYMNYARYGMQPSIVSALVGNEFVSMRYSRVGGILSSNLLLRTASGDVYRWNPVTGSSTYSCTPTCVYTFSGSVPIFIGTFTENFTDASMYSSSTMTGIADIDANLDVVFSVLDQQGNISSVETIDLPNNRQAKQITNSFILATDGTMWDFSYLRYGIRQRDIPLSVRPVARIASRFAEYVIGGAGHVYGVSGAPQGSCAAPAAPNYWERQSSFRVSSNGQFGPAFSEDSFMFSIDSPNERNFMTGDWAWGRLPKTIFGNAGSIEALNVRPANSVELYAYFDSSCEDSSNLSIEWDLDDDGNFEITGTVEPVEPSKTHVTTSQQVNPETESGEYLGLSDAYRQSKVTVTAESPGGDLLTAGGRYISVKVTSPSGSVEQRIPVIVVPAKPTGRVGVTINSGDRFTDSNAVELGVVWPEGVTSMVVSNDGSFADAKEIPVTSKTRWNLPTGGSGLLPTTIYVRFVSIWPDAGGWVKSENEWNYTDDIVLDLSPPVVTSVSALAGSSTVAQSMSLGEVARSMSSMMQTALVSLSVFDSASGISAIQVTDDTATPGPARAYSTQMRVPVQRGTIAVRAKDNVGHWSPWNYARVSGFVPVAETPATPPVLTPIAPSSPGVIGLPVIAPAPQPVLAPPAQSPGGSVAPAISAPGVAVAPAATTTTATAKLVGKTAKVLLSLPASVAKVCKTSTVKGKKVSTCKAAPIVVSVSGGASKTISAKAGSNSLSLPAKKGQTITVKVNGKVVKKIKL